MPKHPPSNLLSQNDTSIKDGIAGWDYRIDDYCLSNRQRALAAWEAINNHTDFKIEPESELGTYVGDMLSNMMHLCRLNDIDFDDCLRRGEGHFNDETEGDLDLAPKQTTK